MSLRPTASACQRVFINNTAQQVWVDTYRTRVGVQRLVVKTKTQNAFRNQQSTVRNQHSGISFDRGSNPANQEQAWNEVPSKEVHLKNHRQTHKLDL